MFLKPKVFLLKKTSILFKDIKFLSSSFQLKEPVYLAELKELKTFNFSKINWESDRTYLFLNPKMPLREKAWVQRAFFPYLKGHIWLSSSGRSSFFSLKKKDSYQSFLKFVALSKKAFLSSARDVNRHIKSHKGDIWFNVLPSFHVGGLSIFARAYLSKAKVVSFDLETWNAKSFLELLYKKKMSLTSLVPAQLWDLVRLSLRPPESLRALFVGGDRMSPLLYSLALQKGWKVLPTYGLTECASQVATADLKSLNHFKKMSLRKMSLKEMNFKKRIPLGGVENLKGLHSVTKKDHLLKKGRSIKSREDLRLKMPFLKILPSIKVRIKDKKIQIRSSSLLTGLCLIFERGSSFYFQNKKDWFNTEDLGRFPDGKDLFEDQNYGNQEYRVKDKGGLIQGRRKSRSNKRYLLVEGRRGDEIKVGGELVSLSRLFFIFDELRIQYSLSGFFKLIATPSLRLGKQVDLVLEKKSWKKFLILLKRYQKEVMPFERIRNVYVVQKIKKTALFKERRDDLWNQLGFSFVSMEVDP